MKYLLCLVLLLSSCAFVLSRSANKDEIDIVDLVKDRLSLPKTSNKELIEKLGIQKSTWEKTKEYLGKSEEQYIVETLKERMGLPLDDKSNIILKDELLGLPSFQIPHRTWLQRLADTFGLGRKSMKERLYDALGGAAALDLLRRTTSDIGGHTARKVEGTMEGLKNKAYEKIGDNVAGNIKQKGQIFKDTITCDTKECTTSKMAEKDLTSPGLLWGMLSTVSYYVFGNRTKATEHPCSSDYYSAKECAKEKAKETLENAKDTVVCTAEMAKDKLCDIKDSVLEKGAETVYAAKAATHRVEDMYETAKHKVEDVIDRSKQKASEAVKDVKDTTKGAYEGAKEKAKDTLEGAKEKAKDAYAEVKEKTKETLEGAKEKAKDAYEGVKDTTKGAYEGATDVYEEAKERAKDKYEDVKNKGKETLEGAKERASDIYEGTKEKAQRVYEGAKDTAEGAKDTAYRVKEQVKGKVGEKYEEAKEKLSETKDNILGKLDLTRDEEGVIGRLRNRVGISKDEGYLELLEKLGYGSKSLPASSRVNLTPEEIRVVEKLNEYHEGYRRKPALEQFKENIGYNEEPAYKHTRHEHLREQAGMEGKAFPEDIQGFGDVIKEQKNLKGRIPV